MQTKTLGVTSTSALSQSVPLQGKKSSVLLGCFLALLVSNGVIITLTFSTLLKPVSAELGLSRTQATLALLVALAATAAFAPWFGRMVDRYGVRRVAIPAIAGFAVLTACLGWIAFSAASLIAMYAALGAVSAGHAPTAFAKVVVGWFRERRGLALGAAMSAVGVGGAAAPIVTKMLIDQFGWRGAYTGLGALIAIVAIPATLFLIREPAAATPSPAGLRNSEAALKGSAVWRDRDFCVMAIIFALMGMAATGVISHLVPLLTDRGMPPASAVRSASIAGLALIGGRLGAGLLLDWLGGRAVTLVFLFLMIIGICILLLPGFDHPILPAVLVGLGLGAEVDLLGYLLSSRFGLASFASRYGVLFGVFTVSSGVGSLFMGMTFDRTGGYQLGLFVLIGALIAAIAFTLALPKLAREPQAKV